MSEDTAAHTVPTKIPAEATAAVGDFDGSKNTTSCDSDGGDEGDDDEDFQPDPSQRKKPRKSPFDNEGGGVDDDVNGEGVAAGTPAMTDSTSAVASSKEKQQQQLSGPTVSGGLIDFPLAPVQSRLICTLCMGYFRDPYTIAECLHTFCKSCLFFAFRSGYRRCPECETSLEPDPFKEVLSDRTMQTLVDKMFPHLKEKDDMDEKEFYERRGIKIKKEFQDEAHGSEKETTPVDNKSISGGNREKTVKDVPDDELEFVVMPDENVARDYQMPPLQQRKLRASGRLKVSSLKRYLIKRLQIKASPASVEICCNGDPLGDELSMTFINRTRWIDPSEEIQLTYRFGEEGIL